VLIYLNEECGLRHSLTAKEHLFKYEFE
jgi:hypothetical protein